MNFNLQDHPVLHARRTSLLCAGGRRLPRQRRPGAGSRRSIPSERNDSTAFGEDTQRGYNQMAFFGSVDFDIIPKVLTITGGTR